VRARMRADLPEQFLVRPDLLLTACQRIRGQMWTQYTT